MCFKNTDMDEESSFDNGGNTFEDSEIEARARSFDTSKSDSENFLDEEESDLHNNQRKKRPQYSYGCFDSRPPLVVHKNLSSNTGHSRNEHSNSYNVPREASKLSHTKYEHSLTSGRMREESGERPKDLEAIYAEIAQINTKLKEEFRVLGEKERAVKERENMLIAAKINWDKTISIEVQHKIHACQQEHKVEIKKLDQILREKERENKRLKENFDTLKAANDTLKKQLESLQVQHSKVEKQSASLQARLTNLQRKREHEERKEEFLPSRLVKDKKPTKEPHTKVSKPKATMNAYEVLTTLLEWVSEVNLRHTVTDQPTKPLEVFNNPEFMQMKCLKVLPSLVEILKELPSTKEVLVLPFLQFIYWSLVHIDQAQGHQKTSLVSTLRRLGEELYKPRVVKFSEDGAESSRTSSHQHTSTSPPRVTEKKESREGAFFKSSNLHVRLLSSLIILKTLTQVDLVANVFEVLRSDLKGEPGKELFLYYQATNTCASYLKPANKMLAHCAVDIFLQMSMESPTLGSFLESCSNEIWFRSSSMVFRMPNMEDKLIEKLSIIFQKLSKIRSNKRYFEVYGITSAVQEMLRTHGPDNAFLGLNLKSVLFNLNVKVASLPANTKSSQPS